MYSFTNGELEAIFASLRECINDCSCLSAWVDSLEYDIKEYVSPSAFKAFDGFVNSLEQHLVRIREICKSKEFDLLL